jgi:hypothetical protein
MRYSVDEENGLIGIFATGKTVTIKLLNIITDTLVDITTNVCHESTKIPGVYIWSTSNIINSKEYLDTYVNMLYEMRSDDDKVYYGKFIYGGYVEKLDTIIALN